MSKWVLATIAHSMVNMSRSWLQLRVRDGLVRHRYDVIDGQRRLYVHMGDLRALAPKKPTKKTPKPKAGKDLEIGQPVTVTVNGRRGTVASAPKHKRFIVVEYAAGYCETWRYNEIKVEGRRK